MKELKERYQCGLCDRKFISKEAAQICEDGHVIYEPKLWWLLIPFYSMILPFYLTVKKVHFIIKNETDKQFFINTGTVVLPMIVFILTLMLLTS